MRTRLLTRSYNTIATNLTDFPLTKRNTVLNIGKQGRKFVIERFGKFVRIENPGLFCTFPFIERIYEVDTRQLVIDVANQNAFTSDNVAVSVAAQLYVNVVDPATACYKVQQPLVAVVSQAQSALRTALGKQDLDHLLKDRNVINVLVQDALHNSISQWGIDVSRFEITELTPDHSIQQAMDLQSKAERERRATVITAEGKKIAIELEAEGRKNAMQKDAEGKRISVELEAEGMLNASKSLEKVSPEVLSYWVQNMHIKMVGELAQKGNHNSYFVDKGITQLPVFTEWMANRK